MRSNDAASAHTVPDWHSRAAAPWRIERDTNAANFLLKERENARDPAVRSSILEHLKEIRGPANALAAAISEGTRRPANNSAQPLKPEGSE